MNTIVITTVAVVGALLMGLQRALRGAAWDRDRRRAFWSVAALLVSWFFAALSPVWLGFYQGSPSRIPTIQYGLLIPIAAGVVLFWVII